MASEFVGKGGWKLPRGHVVFVFTSFVPHKIRVPYKVGDYLISVVFACVSRLLPYNTLFMDLTCQSFFFRVCRSVEIEKRGCSRLWPDIKLSWSSAAFSRISEKLAAWCVPSGEGGSVTVHLASPPSPRIPITHTLWFDWRTTINFIYFTFLKKSRLF